MKNLELIPPAPGLSEIEEYILNAENALEIIRRNVKSAPKGHLRISSSNNTVQFYNTTENSKPKGEYIQKSRRKLIESLAQKDYLEKELSHLSGKIKMLRKITLDYNKICGCSIFEQLNITRQQLITPVTLPLNQLLEKWNSISYKALPFSNNVPEYYTSSGIRVRSKSEIIIAELLTQFHIPFHYEMPLKLTKRLASVTIHPDFCCLNTKTHKILYWEHLGMMDSPEYAKSTVKKINLYIQNGFIFGKNLIVTMETSETPLSTRILKQIIEQYFL